MADQKGPSGPPDTAVVAAQQQQPLREDLIEKAIGFLTHPKVADTSLARKRDFLREKKGMTEAEINEAVRRAGADAPAASQAQRHVVPMAPQSLPPREESGVGVWGPVAASVAVVAAGVAGYYGLSQMQKKPKKKDASTKKKKRSESAAAVVPPSSSSSSVKKSAGGKGKSEDDSHEGAAEAKELQAGFETALQAQADEYAKRMQEVEKLLKMIEENNKQKFELLKPNDDLKNDIHTIKQLLLTRQASAQVVGGGGAVANTNAAAVASSAGEKEKDEAAEEAAGAAASPAEVLLSASSPAGGLKPWEARRRARLDAVPATTGVAASVSPPPPAVAATPAAVGGMEEEKV
jgi:hypothetical protein